MTPHINVLDNMHGLSNPIQIAQPDGKIIVVKKTRTVTLGDGLILKEVLYTPTFQCNLISVQKLAREENYFAIYGVDFYVLQDLTPRKLIGMDEMRNGVYYMKTHTGGKSYAALSHKESSIWHRRLEYPSFGSLFTFSKDYGILLNKDALGCCDVCHKAKRTRHPFPISDSREDKPFSLIHFDLWGKYHTASLGGCHYFLCIVDDFSRRSGYFFLRINLKPIIDWWIFVP